MTYVLLAAAFGLLPALIGFMKGQSFVAWWAYGTLLSVVALAHALMLESEPADEARGDTKTCGHCGQANLAANTGCMACGLDFAPAGGHARPRSRSDSNRPGLLGLPAGQHGQIGGALVQGS